MGIRMSKQLLDADFDVVGHDIRDAAVERLERAGGRGVPSPAAVATSADVVVTSLPTPDVVADVFTDEDGLFAGGNEGLTMLETSTSVPETTRTLAEVASEEGMQVVDAPVSGGTEGARDGTLALMVGATESALDPIAIDVLSTIGEQTYYLGDVGTGHATKLANNVLFSGHLVLAMEAMALGAAHGVDAEMLFEVISNSSGTSGQFEKRVPRVLNRNFEPGFTVDLTKKDVRLASRTADEIDHPMALTSLVHELYKEASASGHGEADAGAIAKIIEAHADVSLESAIEMDETFEGY
jgi:3-hydroxyisobutyrate dehydrogenase-like beta-hydroxyacid dehydrogenase